jgi:hypothetical protein
MKLPFFAATLCALFVVIAFLFGATTTRPDNRNRHGVGAPMNDVSYLDYIPIFADSDLQVVSRSSRWNKLTYQVNEDVKAVTKFYESNLPKHGWIARAAGSNSANALSHYLWTDPQGQVAWHMQMYIVLQPTDSNGTHVTLEVGRYPYTESNLPVYRNTEQPQLTVVEEQNPKWKGIIRTITKTFVTTATEDEIANYYNTTLPDYGWMFFRRGENPGPVSSQTGDIASGEGLYYASNRPDPTSMSSFAIDLFITAHHVKNGQLEIQLKVIETEVPEWPTNGLLDH